MYLNLQLFISNIDYRWRIQYFPQDLNRILLFNPLNCFAIHFKTILVRFLCVLDFLSISGLLFFLEDYSLADTQLKGLNEGALIRIKQFGVACSAIHITNHCYQWLPKY